MHAVVGIPSPNTSFWRTTFTLWISELTYVSMVSVALLTTCISVLCVDSPVPSAGFTRAAETHELDVVVVVIEREQTIAFLKVG